jgi:hypothetical protein
MSTTAQIIYEAVLKEIKFLMQGISKTTSVREFLVKFEDEL